MMLFSFQCHTASIFWHSRFTLMLHVSCTHSSACSPPLWSFGLPAHPPLKVPSSHLGSFFPFLLWCQYTYIFSLLSASCFFSTRPPTCKSQMQIFPGGGGNLRWDRICLDPVNVPQITVVWRWPRKRNKNTHILLSDFVTQSLGLKPASEDK